MQRWYNWLVEMKKKGEEKKIQEEHQKLVSRMIASAEGTTGLLHKITKPTAWRGGVQILEEEQEDTKPLARWEEKRKEWAKHWQCGTEMQDLKDKPWRNVDLKQLEEDMPRIMEKEFQKAAGSYKAKTGVGCDGFHPKVPLDLTKETIRELVEFMEKVEQCGRWPQQACTTMFFLIPKNVTSKRPIALMPTMIRWWQALRAPEVTKWQHVEWDATGGRNGGAERTVWVTLLEVEKSKYHAGERDQGAIALVLDLAKAFERWAWATHFNFLRKILRVLCGYFEHQRRVQFESCVAEPFQTITAILPGSRWSFLLLCIVLQDALCEVIQIDTASETECFCGRHHSLRE